MAAYTVTHETANGTNLPILNVAGGASNQLFFDQFSLASDETAPAEQIGAYNIVRTTDAGTGGSALTEVKVNPLTSAPVGAASGGAFSTAVPTVGDILKVMSVHQKLPWEFQLYPGKEYISAAAAGDGIEVESNAASSAFSCVCTIGWSE